MSQRDRQRWDKKWAGRGMPFLPHALLWRFRHLATGGMALDVACGQGQNSIWLAQYGYQVLAVDISRVALARGRRQAGRLGLLRAICFVQGDLDNWRPPAARFDLVVVFRFLNRELLPALQASLKPGGLFFYETFHQGWREKHPTFRAEHLLQRGELATFFAGWRLLHWSEDDELSSVVARRPGAG